MVYIGVVAAAVAVLGPAFGLAAGVRLLRPGTAAWYGVIVAAAVMVLVLLFSGWALLVPLLLGAAGAWSGQRARQEIPAKPDLPTRGQVPASDLPGR